MKTLLFGFPQGGELIIILVVVLLLFGGKKIPELMSGIGKGVRGFKDGLKDIEKDIKEDASTELKA
ncbi:Sec-independent protein translocase protein TatA [Bacteroidia bacterium]|nr:Sec-independent protein translocase protein TatA [Bacteroidia bacterium]